ncbi:trichohyalin [Topomyia yanbarensis]|uniref:trichohyalin n=1 Tax=Topomyia yanbarensis TaxID=2498891 RepID=UPI00273B3C65|nr:trichohyalin [Topomyia yanbarensis]XP_058838864.1 trichohyalin [Topomyia yanbarensis]XP_058838865.1 trichohyalin [Topomyia yanbarensis]XP_058838866.1 trichohyalin [Topomyia yanbarensis]
MSTQELHGRSSKLLQRYQSKAVSQDPLQQPMDTSPIIKSTSQRSLQNSTLLQKHYSKPNVQQMQSEPRSNTQDPEKISGSQRNLERSKLLQRYSKQHSLDSQDVSQHEPQHYSSQKSLEGSKLLQRYNRSNNSQEFSGLSVREGTPVTRFARSGSLDQDRLVRPSLLSRYTPKFGQSLDRKNTFDTGGFSNYSSQHSLDQRDPTGSMSQAQTFGDYSSDHFDQYDSRNLRSRSSSMARGLARRSASRELMQSDNRNIPLDPVTPETLPMVTASEPVMGNIASALPIPMLNIVPETLPTVATSEPVKSNIASALPIPVIGNIASALPIPTLSIVPPTPAVDLSQPTMKPFADTHQTISIQPAINSTEPVKPNRKEPAKPPRKDLSASAIVSIPIPTITTTINVDPPKSIIKQEIPVVQSVTSSSLFNKVEQPKPIIKQAAPVVPIVPSPPLFSNRDRMEHYGSASNPSPSSASPQQPLRPMSTKLQLPVSDLSGRRSMTDLRQSNLEQSSSLAMEIDESSERNEMRNFSQQKAPVARTLASAFEQIAVLSVPHAAEALDDVEDKIELLPVDRKLKKRDHTYHPSFVPKQSKLAEDENRKEKEKQEKKKEHDRKLEEERAKKEKQKKMKDEEHYRKEEEKKRKEEDKRQKADEEKRRREAEKLAKEDEKRMKIDEEKTRKEEQSVMEAAKQKKASDEKRKREEEKVAKEHEKKMKTEELKIRKEEEKIAKEEEKRLKDEEKRKRDEEKKKLKEEKKKGVLKKSLSADQPPEIEGEDEIVDFGSHLEQYSISGPEKPRGTLVSSPRSGEILGSSQVSKGRNTLPLVSKPMHSSQLSLDRATGVQSKMLQRYAKRSGSQDYTHSITSEETQQFFQKVHQSQSSLDHQRASRSTLLQKYTPQPLSASSAVNQTPSPVPTTQTSSQLSLDKTRLEKSSLLQRYKLRSEPTGTAQPTNGDVSLQHDKEQRLSAVLFQQKKRPEKYGAFDYRDHEYEPIGEAVDSTSEAKPSSVTANLALPSTDIKRKLSSASLRVPEDDADTISMEELQRDIEDRYFNREAEDEQGDDTIEASEPKEDAQEKVSKMKTAMARAQESGKKAIARAQESSKNAMVKAQVGGKNLHQKLRKQTDKFRTKMSNINVKKEKDSAPLASPEIVTTPGIEKLDFTIAEPKSDNEAEESEHRTESANREPEADEPTVETVTGRQKFKALKNIHMPKIQKPDFKRPEFSKITKPKLPKLKSLKRPEMPKFLTEKPDFSKLKMPEKIGTIKLQRSKSMKEQTSDEPSTAHPSEIEVPSAPDTKSNKKKKTTYTNFSTYPRFLDKFKRQKSAPGNASIRASTPPPLEFTKVGKTSRTKEPTFLSRWADKSSEGAGSSSFFSGSELGEREASVEKHMRQRLEGLDIDAPELAVTAEQKQLEEYDKENREIHLLSAARHDEFLKRKPPMERQESDLASEEEKQFWASSLGQKIRQNIDMNSNDFDFLDEEDRLRRENEATGFSESVRNRFLDDSIEHSEKDYDMRSTTPYSNKECQSSGSSGIRRRKGVLEEIDDDEFFLRQKGISKDNIQMGEYISSAIKEGLSTPKNALAEMGRYEPYDDEDIDTSERVSIDYRGERGPGGLRYYQPSFESDDLSTKQSFTDEFRRDADFYKTFPPDRPIRKHKKAFNVESYEDDNQKVPYDTYQEEEGEVEFYDRGRKYASAQPEIHPKKDEHYIDDESVDTGFSRTGAVVPPTPPRRRKKRFRDVASSELEPFANGLTKKTIYNSFTIGPETHLYPAEVPLAEEESFTTPLPTPRRSRSRSQLSQYSEDDRAFRAAAAYVFGPEDGAWDKRNVGLSESNGYATVRKEPPPRPPAPIRRRKSTRSLEVERQFSTLPNYHSVSPMRPTRNYSTISPNRPPRNKSVSSLNENQMKPSRLSKDDITQYEAIEDVENQSKLHHTLQSGTIVSKMKDRPLPPPPRPPRDGRKPRKPEQDDRFDFDRGTERIITLDQSDPRVVEEVETAVQTDLAYDEYELDIEVSETFGATGGEAPEKPAKTLKEILKEEQLAELDRARQLAEASNLMRDIQKFRDSTSSLSLHGSRPETPAVIVLERRVSAPYTSSIRSQEISTDSANNRPLSSDNLNEQDLADDDKYIAELVKKYVSDEKVAESSKKPQRRATESEDLGFARLEGRVREQMEREEMRSIQSEPAVPPRRRSLIASNQDLQRSVELSSDVIEEIVERLRTNEQQHIAELHQIHMQQLEDLRKQQEEQKQLQEQKLEEQQKQLLEQQNQQLHETQQLKEQILQQQEQQKALLQQQQQQQQQLLLAQQQQQILLQQQEKERELQREKERELLREREIELEKARERERELHHARELELQRARDLEQQRSKELEQQRLRELELQRTMELEHQRLRELELQRIQETEIQRAREAARDAELQRARDAEIQRIREAEMQRLREVEMLRVRESSGAVGSTEWSIEQEANESAHGTKKATHEAVTVEPEATKEVIPTRPPLPRISPQIPVPPPFAYQEYMQHPQSFYPTRNYSDEEGAIPQAPHRRRKHHRSRRESTSEEEFHREHRKQCHETRTPEPSIPTLSRQLIRACGSSIRQTGDDLMTILRASSKDEKKRDLHIALIILIVIVAGLMALGMSAEKAVHHHHWDYFNPPGNSGNT